MKSRVTRAIGLFGFLMALYFATYSGRPVSGDEQVMLDGAHSFYRNGSLELAFFNDLRPYFPAPPNRIVLTMDVEPLQSYAAAAVMWLAALVPGIGLVHAVWTLNLWVTAATAVVLYDLGLALGYRDRTALIVALLFGTATIAWPYSGFYFREPLFTLLALACADCLVHWRRTSGRRRWLWFAMAGGAFALALLTKGIALLLLPALFLLIIPRPSPRMVRKVIAAAIVTLIASMGVFFLYQRIAPGVRYRFAFLWLAHLDLSFVGMALTAWLFSPGFSLWVFSPVLLLAVIGAIRLPGEKPREFAFPLVLSVSLVLGYAVLQGQGWYSGLGWGPRYLVPLTPFLALWLLPVIENCNTRPTAAIVGAVVLLSILVQLLAVYVPVETFSTTLFNASTARPILPWQDGVWTLAYTPLAVNLRQLGQVGSQIAWLVNRSGLVVLPLCLLSGGLGLLAVAGRRAAALAVMIAVPLMLYAGLRSFDHDPWYRGDNADLWQVLDRLNTELKPDDAILLNDDSYRSFFVNYYKGRAPIYLLPKVPTESDGPDQATEVSDNPDDQVHPYLWTLLTRLARRTTRWWFVTDSSAFASSQERVNEHFLAQHFFHVREAITTPLVRLVEFSPFSAPPMSADAINRLNVDYGAARLIGFDLPRGREFRPGSIVPVSLVWRHEGWPPDLQPFDYGVNISLLNAAGTTIAQHAGVPAASLGFMSRWREHGIYRDNAALVLPSNLSPGTYQIWVSVYDWRSVTNLPVRNAVGPADHAIIGTILVLDGHSAH